MTTANIFQLSASMQAKGFEYATMFKGSTPFGPFRVKSIGHKPVGSLFFSKIRESWMNEDDETPCVAPDWCNWVRFEEFHVDDYSMRYLMFAKFDPQQLVYNTNNLFNKNGPFRCDYNEIISIPNWGRLTNSFSGIHVDPCLDSNSEIFGNWDVDTVAIWNAYAFTDVRVFRNSGIPWTYEV
jgi:hypothetical protein